MDQNGESNMEKPTTFKKILNTVLLITTWICLGLCGEISGPTLRDLKLRTNSDYEDVSRALSGRSIGFFTGAAIGGYLVDRLPRHFNLMIGMCLSVDAGGAVITPFSQRTIVLWLLFLIQGTAEGIINIVGQKIILQIWMEKASSPMHALHLGFGIGSFIAPEIANPFLAVFSQYRHNDISHKNSTTLANGLSTTLLPTTLNSSSVFDENIVLRESKIEWAYMIISIITLCVSFTFYITQFCSCGKTRKGEKSIEKNDREKQGKGSVCKEIKSIMKMIDPGTCAGGRRLYSVQILALLFLHFFNAVGGERLLGKFIRTYAIDEFNFSGDDATFLNTTFWISFAFGRFIGFVAAKWIPVRILLLIESTGGLVTGLLLNIFAYENPTALWALTQAMGFFLGPMFPSGIAWGDSRVEMTGIAITILIFGGSIGGVSYLWIIGYLYDNFGYRTFLYLILAYGIASAVIDYLMYFVTLGSAGRFVLEAKQRYTTVNKDMELDVTLDELSKD